MVMILIISFHFLLWVIYALFWNGYKNSDKLNTYMRNGDLMYVLEKVHNSILKSPVHFVLSTEEEYLFNPFTKRITYFTENKDKYSLYELFSSLHEIIHAKQLEDNSILYKVRMFWSKHVKKPFITLFVFVLYISVVGSLLFDFHKIWYIFGFLIFIHYIYSIIVVCTEWDANNKAYVYMKENIELSEEELNTVKKTAYENTTDYIINIPLLFIFG